MLLNTITVKKWIHLFNPTLCSRGLSSRLGEGGGERVEGQELRRAGEEQLCLTGHPHCPPPFSDPCRDKYLNPYIWNQPE